MTEPGHRSWNELIDALHKVASELRSTLASRTAASAEGEAAASRLKGDMARLEQAAANLRATLAGSMQERRAGFEESFDRERAEESASKLQSSLSELVGLAKSAAVELGAAAGTTFEQARPEIASAASALEDAAGSAAAWARAILDPRADRSRGTRSADSPPLDDL